MLKTCPLCKTSKPVEDFSRQAKSKDGRYPYCKTCAAARHKAHYHSMPRDSWLNEKQCSWCRQRLPRACFNRDLEGHYASRCQACEQEIAERSAAGERRCNICRVWLPLDQFYPSHLAKEHAGCKECIRAWHRGNGPPRRDKQLRREFGITLAQYFELIEKQGGKCPVCLVPFEPGNSSYHLDHAHSGPFKGRIRAIVHSECNRTVLWSHEDGAVLRRAADIIDNPLTDWMVPGIPPSETRKLKRKK